MPIILCPYCASRIDEDTVDCPACGLDTTCDAKLELSESEFGALTEKSCRQCGSRIAGLAFFCPSCRRWEDS